MQNSQTRFAGIQSSEGFLVNQGILQTDLWHCKYRYEAEHNIFCCLINVINVLLALFQKPLVQLPKI